MHKKSGKNISKKLSFKYSPGMLAVYQTLLDHNKKFSADAFKTTLKRAIQKKHKRLVI